MIKAVDLRKGKLISHDDQLYSVHSAQHVAKGNKRSYIQAKLKSVKSGSLTDVRFSVDDRIETPYVDNKPYEFLYRDGQDFVMMDQETFDQIHVSADAAGNAGDFLKGNEVVQCSFIEGEILGFELPNVVELEVTDTIPAIKGATATNQNKDAVLETGLRIKVPPFVENGTVVRVDTRTGEYLERAKS